MDSFEAEDGQEEVQIDESAEAVLTHIHETVGPVSGLILDDSDGAVPIHIAVVDADEDRDFHVLVTAGMSSRAQELPGDDGPEDHFTELVMFLPPEWLMDMDAMEEQRHNWPIQWLREVAAFPHEEGTFVCPGQTIQFLDDADAKTYGMPFVGLLLYVPSSLENAFNRIDTGDAPVHLVSCIPLYREELDFADEHGPEALVDKLVEAEIAEIVDVTRPKAVP